MCDKTSANKICEAKWSYSGQLEKRKRVQKEMTALEKTLRQSLVKINSCFKQLLRNDFETHWCASNHHSKRSQCTFAPSFWRYQNTDTSTARYFSSISHPRNTKCIFIKANIINTPCMLFLNLFIFTLDSCSPRCDHY